MPPCDWWLGFLLLFAVAHSWPDPRRRADGEPWPKPVHIEFLGINRTISKDLIVFSVSPCDIIQEATKRYRPRFLLTNVTAPNSVRNIVVDLPDWYECPSVVPESMDESYSVRSTSPHTTIYISANEVWGALRGLETLSQLVIVDSKGRSILPIVKIRDEPRFPHRGVLLDTARHFLSVNILKSTLDLMSQNKFNVFHWHIVDSQSFPYRSDVYPEFSKGAYSSEHIYTINQVKDVVAYARLRGIRVIPEFDTPGHMGGWGIGVPEILTKCYDEKGHEVPDREMVDPTKENTWNILLALFTAFEVFPDSFFHLGGDETEYWASTCWENNRDVQHFMRLYDLKNVTELQQWYFTQLLGMLSGPRIKNKKKFIAWQEVFDFGIKLPGAIGHVWKGSNGEEMDEIEKVTAAGHNAILSSCWYLDRITANYADWEGFYKCDPHGFNGTAAQKRLVLGGEAALWGEWVDETNLISRLFPRASVVAERLWSPANTTQDPEKEYPRLYGWACKMVSRGYPVGPVYGPSYCPHEYHANLPF